VVFLDVSGNATQAEVEHASIVRIVKIVCESAGKTIKSWLKLVVYKTFFRNPPDESVTIVIPRSAALDVRDLKTFPQKVAAELTKLPARSKLIEIDIVDEIGSHFSLSEYLNNQEIFLLPDYIWKDNFEPSFNFYVFRDSQGNWPIYVFKLLSSRTPLLLRDEIAALEESTDLVKLFLVNPGRPEGDFTNSLVGTNTARKKAYASAGSALIYLWSGSEYLILATTSEGAELALKNLNR